MRKLNNEISSKINRSMILTLIHQNPLISRAQLSLKTGLDRSTITHILNYLLREGLVEEVDRGKAGAKGGRCPILLKVRYNAKFLIQIEIGYNNIQSHMTNLSGVEIKSWETKIRRGEPLLGILNKIIGNIMKEKEKEFKNCVVIGISSPGIVDVENGIMKLCSFHNWKDIEVVKPLSEKYGKHFFIENDANTAAIGELEQVAANGKRSLIYLLIRESPPESKNIIGIGGAIIFNGKLWHGSNYFAGEVAETVNSEFLKGKVKKWRENSDNHSESKTLGNLLESAAGGNQEAKLALNEIVSNLGKLLSELVAFLDPYSVIVHLCSACENENFVNKIMEYYLKYSPPRVHTVHFYPAALKDKAIMKGLVSLSQEKVFIREPISNSILF